jgi:hypothetical protein
MSNDVYEVYAIRYGHHPCRRRPITSTIRTTCCSRSTSSSGRSSARPAPIVVDTGFDEAMGKKRQREMIKPVVLACFGP